jgi:hypothetical protein
MFDTEKNLETVWAALESYRENCIPEGDEAYDAEWEDITHAMALIREELGLPSEVEIEGMEVL